MNKILIPILAVLLSGCTTLASQQAPKVSQIAYKPMLEVPVPEEEQGHIVLAVYQFGDLTGQQKPNTNFGEISKAVTQGSANLLIKALKDVGDGKWFRVVERESLQSLLQERKLIRTTRQMTQGVDAKPLGPMLYAGAYLTGGIIGYDSNTLSGGVGYRFLGIGAHVEYRHDTVTVMLRLINVVSGEVELAIMTEKTIMSVGSGADKFKYLDLDTKLVEIEAGLAINEPVTYAVRKTIEGAVVEMIRAGEVKGLWHYAPKGFDAPAIEDNILPVGPVCDPPCAGEDGRATITEVEIEEVLEALKKEDVLPEGPTDDELLEIIKKEDEKDTTVEPDLVPVENEVIDTPAEAETTPAPQTEQVNKPVKVKVEPPLSDAIKCESGPHHYRCYEDETTNTSTDTTATDR